MKNLDNILNDKKLKIDESLNGYLERGDKFCKPLYQAMHYSVSAGGKRLRPSIVLLVGEILANRNLDSKLLPYASSLEMIHTYSLIHDDLPSMDNDDFRRGVPTLHKKFDESTAILAGDALFSYAIEIFLSEKYFEKEHVYNALSNLIQSVGPDGMVSGQYVDTKIENYIKDIEILKYVHRLKTGALFASAFSIPAVLMNKKRFISDNLEELGMSAGLLFQIVDDILDVTATTEVLGKTAGKDLKQNKLTYVSLFGLKRAKEEAEKEAMNAHALADKLDFDMSLIHNLIDLFAKRIK